MSKEAWLCRTAWIHDLDEDNIGYIQIFASKEAAEEGLSCAKQCGLVKVKLEECEDE